MVDWRCRCKKCNHQWVVRHTDVKGNPIRPDRCPNCGNPEWWRAMSRKSKSVRSV